MSYKCERSMKVVRTKHIVTAFIGYRAKDLANDIAKVPAEAKIIDLDYADSTVEITFELEEPVNE